jgi:hypothetical protein
MKLRNRVPNFCIHVSVNDLSIPTIVPPILLLWVCGQIVGMKSMFLLTVKEISPFIECLEYINRSQNVEISNEAV